MYKKNVAAAGTAGLTRDARHKATRHGQPGKPGSRGVHPAACIVRPLSVALSWTATPATSPTQHTQLPLPTTCCRYHMVSSARNKSDRQHLGSNGWGGGHSACHHAIRQPAKLSRRPAAAAVVCCTEGDAHSTSTVPQANCCLPLNTPAVPAAQHARAAQQPLHSPLYPAASAPGGSANWPLHATRLQRSGAKYHGGWLSGAGGDGQEKREVPGQLSSRRRRR